MWGSIRDLIPNRLYRAWHRITFGARCDYEIALLEGRTEELAEFQRKLVRLLDQWLDDELEKAGRS